jgi:hypothetical protein
MDLMALGDLSVSLLTIRNILLVALLVYANMKLSTLAKAGGINPKSQAAL